MKVIRTELGDAEIFQVIEIEIGPEVHQIFDNATLEELSKTPWLFPNYVTADGRLRSLSQTFVVKVNGRIVVVDTCIGNDKIRTGLPQWANLQTDFLKSFAQTGLKVEDVTDVLCTHLHADHIGWNTTLENGSWRPTFPNARYYFSRSEYDYIRDRKNGATDDTVAALNDSVQPIVDAGLVEFVDGKTDLGDGISLVPTPGHTIGHVSVRFDLVTGPLFISGDAIHHPCQIDRPDWSANIDYHPRLAAESRRGLLVSALENGALLAGTHFELPSIGRVERAGHDRYLFVAGDDCCKSRPIVVEEVGERKMALLPVGKV